MSHRMKELYYSTIMILFFTTVCAVLAPAPGHTVSLYRGDFVKINQNGFVDQKPWNNSFSWSMAWFKNKIYVGTLRNALEVRAFSYEPPPFDPYPVPVPDNPAELDLRAEIWQYTPETNTWRRVYQSEEFSITLPDGTTVWTARDVGYRVMTVYTDPQSGAEALYVGTNLYIGPEARFLRTTDGENFQTLTFDPGMELPADTRLTSFRSLVPFKGRLYTTPVSSGGTIQGSEVQIIFESVSLDLVNGIFHFRPVSPPAFGDATNQAIFEMAAFNGYLYAGTGNSEKGYQIWKTDGLGETLPYTWTQVIKDGAYRGPLNQGTASMFPYHDRLYVGSGIQSGGYDTTTGYNGQPELIRISADDSWELICGEERETPDGLKTSLSGMGPGFDNIFTGYFWRMAEHEDWLYVSTLDNCSYLPYISMEGFPPLVKDLIEQFGLDPILKVQGGFDLWKTNDGIEWYPITVNGFGNPLNIGLRTFQSTPYGLFAGTTNPFTDGDGKGNAGGTEVWLGKRDETLLCGINLQPSFASVGSRQTVQFRVVVEGLCNNDPNYQWRILEAGCSGNKRASSITQDGLYTACDGVGIDTITVVDSANFNISAAASVVVLPLCSADEDCNDGIYCNGAEVCDVFCQSGKAVDCRDGVSCTDDFCDEKHDTCVHFPNSGNCPDDGLFCTGVESCDAIIGCFSGGNPCLDQTLCDEEIDTCLGCLADEQCNDNNTCTEDSCADYACRYVPIACDDGLYCNGAEACDPLGGCGPGVVPCINDGLFCNGEETCDENNDTCLNSGTPCLQGQVCDEESDICIGINVVEQSVPKSLWMILPAVATIRGLHTSFTQNTSVEYRGAVPLSVVKGPKAVNTATQIIKQIIFVMPSLVTGGNGFDGSSETVTVTVDGLTDTFEINMLNPLLAQQGAK